MKALLRPTKLPAVLSAALLVSFTVSAASAVSVSPDDATAQGPSYAKEVEAFADSFFNRSDLGVPGAAIVIVKDGKVLLQKGYGFADVEKKQTVDPERTVFRIGSVSKAFTATAVMQLVEQGKIDLDRDMQTHMDVLRIDSRFQEPVTMKHLLTHTTGFDFTEPKPGDISSTASSRLSRLACTGRRDGSVDYKSQQPMLRQEAAALFSKALFS